jgi:hypothetical protein
MASETTCLTVTLSIINPTWTDPGAIPDLRSEKPTINSLSYSTIISTWAYAGIYIRYQINGDAAMTQFYRSR